MLGRLATSLLHYTLDPVGARCTGIILQRALPNHKPMAPKEALAVATQSYQAKSACCATFEDPALRVESEHVLTVRQCCKCCNVSRHVATWCSMLQQRAAPCRNIRSPLCTWGRRIRSCSHTVRQSAPGRHVPLRGEPSPGADVPRVSPVRGEASAR